MACLSIAALVKECGAEGSVGGSDKVYMVAHNDLAVVSGTSVYSMVNDEVTEIGLDSGKTFVEIALLKSTSGLNIEFTKNDQTASNYFTHTFTLVLGGMTKANYQFVESVRFQPVVVLLKTRTNKWFVVGLNGQLELSALTGGSGVAEGDLNGYTLTFSGIDGKQPLHVNDLIVADLIG